MTLFRAVAFSGNAHRPSRTRALVEAVAHGPARLRPVGLRLHDLVDAGPDIGAGERSALPPPAARVVEAIEGADAPIVGSPVCKGANSGLFKHVFDLVRPDALAGEPVALTATGGGARHALGVEHLLRPLSGFFEAQTAATAVRAGEAEIVEGRVVDPGERDRARAAREPRNVA